MKNLLIGLLTGLAIIVAGCGDDDDDDNNGNPVNGGQPSGQWEKTFGGAGEDRAYAVVTTSDDDYVIVGSTRSLGAGETDVYLMKIDAFGDVLWEKTFGGANNDWGYSIAETNDDGFIIVGSTVSFGAGRSDVYVVKTNASGDTLWARTFGGQDSDHGYSVVPTNDSGYIILGQEHSFADGGGCYDLYLIKATASGNTVWTRTFGGPGPDYGYSVAPTNDSGYVIAGGVDWAFTGPPIVNLIKADSQGDTVWTVSFDNQEVWSARSLAPANNDAFVVAGMTCGDMSDQESCDVYLTMIDASGGILWTSTFGGSANDGAYSVARTGDDGYVIVGTTWSFGAGDADVYLIKTDGSGDTLWTRTFGGPADDYGRSVAPTSDGGYIVAGYTESFGEGEADVYLIKVDAYGDM